MQIAEILEKTGQTETMVLREHAILTLLTKLSRYESECALFEKKYGESLESFRNRLEQKMNSESFMEEDDFLDWEYADSARNWWRLKKEELYHDH
jgi:hypothetical protein